MYSVAFGSSDKEKKEEKGESCNSMKKENLFLFQNEPFVVKRKKEVGMKILTSSAQHCCHAVAECLKYLALVLEVCT